MRPDAPRPLAAPLLSCARVDHVALTVPDLDAAAAFFTEVLGARELYRRHYRPGADNAASMAERFNTHPEAACRLAKLDFLGTALELFEYRAPDLNRAMPRNCDAGGAHLGITADNFPQALAALRRVPGVKILGEPSVLGPDHPLAGRRWVYFLTPWGLQMELVSP